MKHTRQKWRGQPRFPANCHGFIERLLHGGDRLLEVLGHAQVLVKANPHVRVLRYYWDLLGPTGLCTYSTLQGPVLLH